MIRTFKGALQVLVGIVVAVQLTGCLFVERDHRRHYDPPEHHDHDPSIDVRIHG